MSDTRGAVDLSANARSPEEQEALDALARDGAPPETEEQPKAGPRQVLTAFVVLVNTDGSPEVLAVNDPDLDMISEPNNDLVYGAAHTIIKDMTVSETAHGAAQMSIQVMQQQAQAAMERAQTRRIAAEIGDPRRA